MASKLWRAFARKRVDDEDDCKGKLARVLGVLDLTALGVGSTLGLGVYVLAASVAKKNAGPAVCVSFFIAAVASAFAAMCYAEFASRVPKAGSAYVYSYVTVGEFIAFVIGWNLVLEYVIGTASVARGLSDYIDALLGNAMRNYLQSIMPIRVSFLSEYPDIFAAGMVLLLVFLLCVGVQESSYFNICFTAVNLLTILTIVVAGAIKADPKNWNISPDDIPPSVKDAGSGGFMPFGVSGVMVGAAECFFGFVGFDGIATTGEEAKNPQHTIPLAIVISLFITFGAYFSIATVLTMMWPYYDQQEQAPFPYVFEQVGWPEIKWIVNVGAIFALCTALLGAMFPLPRVLYAMGSDGVIFKFLAKVHSTKKTPIIGTVVAGVFTAAMTLIFDLTHLIEMMSIGTLLAYTIVAISVLILRYQKIEHKNTALTSSLLCTRSTAMDYFKQLFNLNNQKEPTHFSSSLVSWGTLAYTILVLIFGVILNLMSGHKKLETKYELLAENSLLGNATTQTHDSENSVLKEGVKIACYVGLAVVSLMMLLIVLIIGRQPVQPAQLSFKVPFVPIIPCCSILINLYLMLQLQSNTWIRFGVWMILGFAIYFGYGIRHSEQGRRNDIAYNRKDKFTEPVIITKFQRRCSTRF